MAVTESLALFIIFIGEISIIFMYADYPLFMGNQGGARIDWMKGGSFTILTHWVVGVCLHRMMKDV